MPDDPPEAHLQALDDLERGYPLQALHAWRELLLVDPPRIRRHLQAAEQALGRDAIAPLRRHGLALLEALLDRRPSDSEVALLGALLQGWADLFVAEFPGWALQRYERAWSCLRSPRLRQRLASLYARQGYGPGLLGLGDTTADADGSFLPWPRIFCPTQQCAPCQRQLESEALSASPTTAAATAVRSGSLAIAQIRGGTIQVERTTNPWGHSHAIAVLDAEGRPLEALCRRYPWPWPACPHMEAHHRQAAQLRRPLPPRHRTGAVLAVAELSGEQLYHWQMELLPRLGQAWQQLAESHEGPLWVWHNGGQAVWVQESLRRLGIPPHRCLSASDHPCLSADVLLIPEHRPFAGVGAKELSWLEAFWGVASPADSAPSRVAHRSPLSAVLPRGCVSRRPLLAEPRLLSKLAAGGIEPVFDPGRPGPFADQLRRASRCQRLVAPHGAAMVTLLAAPSAAEVVELVNPNYAPPYFSALIAHRRLRHRRLVAAPTPWPLRELLYEGPLTYPIDLSADALEALWPLDAG
jgi:hypothetical protein